MNVLTYEVHVCVDGCRACMRMKAIEDRSQVRYQLQYSTFLNHDDAWIMSMDKSKLISASISIPIVYVRVQTISMGCWGF
jgi:hypothetical protein